MLMIAQRIRLDNAVQVKQEGLQALDNGICDFDLSRLHDVDSSALAVLLAWKRAAQARKLTLHLHGADGNLSALAQLYGVDELI